MAKVFARVYDCQHLPVRRGVVSFSWFQLSQAKCHWSKFLPLELIKYSSDCFRRRITVYFQLQWFTIFEVNNLQTRRVDDGFLQFFECVLLLFSPLKFYFVLSKVS